MVKVKSVVKTDKVKSDTYFKLTAKVVVKEGTSY